MTVSTVAIWFPAFLLLFSVSGGIPLPPFRPPTPRPPEYAFILGLFFFHNFLIFPEVLASIIGQRNSPPPSSAANAIYSRRPDLTVDFEFKGRGKTKLPLPHSPAFSRSTYAI